MNKPVSLPADEAAYVEEMVRSGAYASASDVVGAGLRALREREAEESWLRDEVGPVYDAMIADPSRAIPANDVFAELRARHAARAQGS